MTGESWGMKTLRTALALWAAIFWTAGAADPQAENIKIGVIGDTHKGTIGAASKSYGATYHFEIPRIIGPPTVIVTADKPDQFCTGVVHLITDGKAKVLGTWDQTKWPDDGLRFDASKHITKPGKYQIEFARKSGKGELVVSAVKIDMIHR